MLPAHWQATIGHQDPPESEPSEPEDDACFFAFFLSCFFFAFSAFFLAFSSFFCAFLSFFCTFNRSSSVGAAAPSSESSELCFLLRFFPASRGGDVARDGAGVVVTLPLGALSPNSVAPNTGFTGATPQEEPLDLDSVGK